MGQSVDTVQSETGTENLKRDLYGSLTEDKSSLQLLQKKGMG
jgi:hypothetical protein